MNAYQNSGISLVAESSTSEHDSVAGCSREDKSVRDSDFPKENLGIKKKNEQMRVGSLAGQEKRVKILPKKDVLRYLHKASLEDSARTLQAMNNDLDFKLTKHGKVQLSELAAMVRILNKEMETVEAVELDISREPLWDTVEEGSSLRSLLESLKLKLETILNQKPELKDKEEHTIKVLKSGCEFEAAHVQVAKGREPCEGAAEASFAMGEKIKADLLRTTSRRDSFHEVEHITLAAEEFENEKPGEISTTNQITTMFEGTDIGRLSKSRSCADVLVYAEGIESSREKEEDPNKLTEIEVAAAISQDDADPKESSFTNFSIRNFVSTARNNNIKANWPFSRRSLNICLKHTIKNLLPPFQRLDYVQSSLTEQCLAETVLPAQGRLDEKPIWLKNHPVSSSCCNGFDQKHELRCTDSNSSPSGIQDLASKVTAHSQSEIESVSTSKIPLSEVLDKLGSDVPTKKKKKGASMFVPNKKRRMVVKLGPNMDHGTTEDITSTYNVQPEVVAQSTCPVCGIFSSSSNTTLNAHIDQCLLVEPTSLCMTSSRTAKARPKPTKIRLMSDICATAPCSTLEDLDIRNGRVIVAGGDSASHAKNLSQGKIEKESLRHVNEVGEKIERESLRHVKNTGKNCGRVSVAGAHLVSHDNKVSDGKIEKESLRQESTSGEQTENEPLRPVMVTSEKVKTDCLKNVKDIADDNAVYIDASGTKIRILSKTKDVLSIPKSTKEMKVKTLKNGKRGKLFSSKKKLLAKNSKFSQAYIPEVCVLGKSTYTGGSKHPDKRVTPVFKIQEEREFIDSGNCFERAVLSENNNGKRKRGRPKRKVQTISDIFVDSQQSCFSNSDVRKDIKQSPTVKTEIASEPNSIDRNAASCMIVVGGKDQFPPRRKSMNSTPLVDGVHSKDIELNTGANLYKRKNSCMQGPILSSSDNEIEIHARGTFKNHLCSHANENPPTCFHNPKEATGLPTLGNFVCPSGKLFSAKSMYSRVEKSCVCSGHEAAVPLTSPLGWHFNSMEADGAQHSDRNKLSSVSPVKMPTGKVVASIRRSSDPEFGRLTATYSSESSLLQFAGSFLVAEPPIHASQPALGDMCKSLYTTEGGNDINGNGSEDFEQENYLPPVESIPIPGPPGSYLPSFRDSGFEYLHTCHGASDINKINSEFPQSTESTICGTTVAHPELGDSENVLHVLAEKGMSDGRARSPAENAIIMSVVNTGDEAEMLTLDVESSRGDIVHQGNEQAVLKGTCQPCCCSQKERMTWDAASSLQEITVLRRQMMAATLEADLGSHPCSNFNTEVSTFEVRTGGCENVLHGSPLSPFGSGLMKDFSSTARKSSCPSGCDSAVLQPPVLRLMGKDVILLKYDEH